MFLTENKQREVRLALPHLVGGESDDHCIPFRGGFFVPFMEVCAFKELFCLKMFSLILMIF